MKSGGNMAYDTAKDIDGSNRPHFYITSDCENIIRALGEYVGDDLHDPWKDPVDVLRYAAAAHIDHMDAKALSSSYRGTGGY